MSRLFFVIHCIDPNVTEGITGPWAAHLSYSLISLSPGNLPVRACSVSDVMEYSHLAQSATLTVTDKALAFPLPISYTTRRLRVLIYCTLCRWQALVAPIVFPLRRYMRPKSSIRTADAP